MRSIYRQSSRGSALLTVTLIGFFVMLLAAALVNHFAVAEANAVAESLAKTRIYWAAMGHVNYALSRYRREGCSPACASNDGQRDTDLTTFLNEINGRVWSFGSHYQFTFTLDVTDENTGDDDGRLRATITLNPLSAIGSSSLDSLANIEKHMRDRLQVDVCLSSPCPSPAAANPSTDGANLIEALQRVKSPPP